jgi:hypothetical protein
MGDLNLGHFRRADDSRGCTMIARARARSEAERETRSE